MRLSLFLLALFIVKICVCQSPCSSVDPFIGTGGHGHTYPGACRPFGMVQLSPDARLTGWDGCGGYHYDDHYVYGFSHTHLQGTGISDYGDILLKPTNGKIRKAETWNEAYKSHFDHAQERAEPGYYAVNLDDDHIRAELTATQRVGIHRYTLAKGDSCRLFIDMKHRDKISYYDIRTHGDTAISGFRVSEAWAKEQHCYFYAVFSRPFKDFTQLDIAYNDTTAEGKVRQIIEQVQVFSVWFSAGDPIVVKVGLSGVSEEGALKNLMAEAPHWDFDRYRKDAWHEWEMQLMKMPLPRKTTADPVIYYSSLYHCFTTPNIWSDVDGHYRGMDHLIHQDLNHPHYTVFSLWDTYRGLHPLLTSTEKERTGDMIHSFLSMKKEYGHLPVWELAANETNCMIGFHSVSVIADAWYNGIRNFDSQEALLAMLDAAAGPEEEKVYFNKIGYVPGDLFSESVSKTLEYAYDNWCIAQFAKSIGNDSVYKFCMQRASYWKNIYDPETRFFRARRNGGFSSVFDPYQVNFNYTEANAWQYRFAVPHDLAGLISLMGGKDAFEKELDLLFETTSKTSGREQVDITGLIGQYAHGNEPSHHMAYLYEAIGKKEKTKNYIDRIMKEMYSRKPDGLCGNEDCGQMSAWYVLTAHQKYPMHPGGATVAGSAKFVAIPVIEGPETSFKDHANVKFIPVEKGQKIHYQILMEDGRVFEGISAEKTERMIDGSCEIRAWSANEKGDSSFVVTAQFVKRNNDADLTMESQYDAQYTGGGDEALLDGLRGGSDFRTGYWQGFNGRDLQLVVDLKKEQMVHLVGLSCLEEIKSWIWFPSSIEIQVSTDGQHFAKAGFWQNNGPLNNEGVRVKELTTEVNQVCRYIRIIAHPAFDQIPSWHLGAGGKPWIFADEIVIR